MPDTGASIWKGQIYHLFYVSTFNGDYETSLRLPKGSTFDQVVAGVRAEFGSMPGLEEDDVVIMDMTTGLEVG